MQAEAVLAPQPEDGNALIQVHMLPPQKTGAVRRRPTHFASENGVQRKPIEMVWL
jgi:hypothetical protein